MAETQFVAEKPMSITGGPPCVATLLAFLSVLLVLVFLSSLSIGATGVLPLDTWWSLFSDRDVAGTDGILILLDIRLPRTLLAMFVGAALAVAGAMMQGMFRNPLADPGLCVITHITQVNEDFRPN